MAIAKNNKFTPVHELDGETIEKVIKDATLSEKKKSNAGTKKLPADDKLSTSMIVYFTEDEKKRMKEYCKNKRVPFSVLVRQMLNEREIL